jgi:hypothetical protein
VAVRATCPSPRRCLSEPGGETASFEGAATLALQSILLLCMFVQRSAPMGWRSSSTRTTRLPAWSRRWRPIFFSMSAHARTGFRDAMARGRGRYEWQHEHERRTVLRPDHRSAAVRRYYPAGSSDRGHSGNLFRRALARVERPAILPRTAGQSGRGHHEAWAGAPSSVQFTIHMERRCEDVISAPLRGSR